MSRFSERLAEGPTFVPFFVLGYPDLERSLALMEAAADAGAKALEVGLPFSDPIADGPVIQTAAMSALRAGFRMESGWQTLARFRARHPQVAVGLLVYAQLTRVQELDAFYARLADAGVDACLVADVPVREADPFVAAALRSGVDPVFIAPPNGAEDVLRQVAQRSQGFVYCVCREGVTGDGGEARLPPQRVVASLRSAGAPGLVAGFGLSTPEHVAEAVRSGLDGAIVGSALVRAIHAGAQEAQVADFVGRCVQAAAQARPDGPRTWGPGAGS